VSYRFLLLLGTDISKSRSVGGSFDLIAEVTGQPMQRLAA